MISTLNSKDYGLLSADFEVTPTNDIYIYGAEDDDCRLWKNNKLVFSYRDISFGAFSSPGGLLWLNNKIHFIINNRSTRTSYTQATYYVLDSLEKATPSYKIILLDKTSDPLNTSKWKSFAYSIKNIKDDIYVVGWVNSQTMQWKNNVGTLLPSSATTSNPTYLAIDGNDVYAAGNSERIQVWKNGVLMTTNLPNQSRVYDLAAVDGHVYVAGYRQCTDTNKKSYQCPAVWIDGKLSTTLVDTTKQAIASKILVK